MSELDDVLSERDISGPVPDRVPSVIRNRVPSNQSTTRRAFSWHDDIRGLVWKSTMLMENTKDEDAPFLYPLLFLCPSPHSFLSSQIIPLGSGFALFHRKILIPLLQSCDTGMDPYWLNSNF